MSQSSTINLRMVHDGIDSTTCSLTESQKLMWMYQIYFNYLEDKQDNVPESIIIDTKTAIHMQKDDVSEMTYITNPFDTMKLRDNVKSIEKESVETETKSVVVGNMISNTGKVMNSHKIAQNQASCHYRSVYQPEYTYTFEASKSVAILSDCESFTSSIHQQRRAKPAASVDPEKKKTRRSKSLRGGKTTNDYCRNKKVSSSKVSKVSGWSYKEKKRSFSLIEFLFPHIRKQREAERIMREKVLSVFKERYGVRI